MEALRIAMTNPSDLRAIRDLAHRLWEARGRRHGHAVEDWLDAERQIGAAQDPVSVAEAPVKPARRRGKGKNAAAPKAPIVPPDDSANSPPETPKVGSRDAPGG